MADDDSSYTIRSEQNGGDGLTPRSGTLGRIALKKVASAHVRSGKQQKTPAPRAKGGAPISPRDPTPIRDMRRGDNPMNRLVPYLDLFARLDDAEIARLASVEVHVATDLRKQVDDISRALAAYTDLLPRLSDDELVRLTGGSPKTIRFWRLCHHAPGAGEAASISSPSMERAEVRHEDSPTPRPVPTENSEPQAAADPMADSSDGDRAAAEDEENFVVTVQE